jgi:hypothetical protein
VLKLTLPSDRSQLGVDPARGGDETVVAVRIGGAITELVAWRTRDLMESVGGIREIATRVGVTPKRAPDYELWLAEQPAKGTIVVDTIGLGGGVADRLKEEGYDVVGFNGNAKPPAPYERHTVQFHNCRIAAYWRLFELMREKHITLPQDPLLVGELLATGYQPTSAGRIIAKPKDEIKKLLGRSPDRADAVCMAVWEPPRISYFGAQVAW